MERACMGGKGRKIVPQVYRASGPKWRLVWGFTLLPEWQEYRQKYSGGSARRWALWEGAIFWEGATFWKGAASNCQRQGMQGHVSLLFW